MAALRTGLASQLTSPVAETTYGVVPSLATAKFSAFKSETLTLKKTVVQGVGLLAGKLHGQTNRRVFTNWTADGAITMDLPTRGLQQWLFPMFGSYGQTKSALTQDGVTGAYNAIHAPGNLEGNSFVLQKGVPTTDNGTVEPVTYCGCKVTDWTLSVATGQIAQLVVTIDARNELAGAGNSDPLNGSVPTLQAYTAPASSAQPAVFHFRQATLFTGGTPSTASGVTTVAGATAAGNVLSAEVKYAIPLDTTGRYYIGKAGFKDEQLQNGLRAVTGQFVIEWLSSEAMYNAFAADTSTALQLQFLGPGIGSGSDFSTFTVLIPDVFLDSAPVVTPGPEPIKQTIPFTGLDDGTNNVIQANYWTLDAS
jgi:Phage tail tube protein